MLKFLEIEPQYSKYETSKFVVVPVPYEETTTYGQGTKFGPAAILKASQQVESFDEERGIEVYKKVGIHTVKPLTFERLPIALSKFLKDKKIPIILGGEHSISASAVKIFKKFYRNLSVLQLDAHADLRASYKGSRFNHACVMRRILEICPAVQVGIRSVDVQDYAFAKKTGQLSKIHFAKDLGNSPHFNVGNIISQLSSNVYLTIDVDVFDPSIIPATGTPEPGGLWWYEVLDILLDICKSKKIVGLDVVELAPIKNLPASDFTIAKLIYKLIGYLA